MDFEPAELVRSANDLDRRKRSERDLLTAEESLISITMIEHRNICQKLKILIFNAYSATFTDIHTFSP